MCQVFEEGLILVRDKGIGIPVERKKKKHKCSQVENRGELIAFFNKIGAESMRKSRREEGPERKGRDGRDLGCQARIQDFI